MTSFQDIPTEPKERIQAINKLREQLHELSPIDQPVDLVLWVPIEKVSPNDYNPNSVAKQEMGLLYKSIKHDGYTQPIVAVRDEEKDRYLIVDGFHRYFTAKTNKDILDRNHGTVPVVVIKKDLNERMAATVRHNRARGEHSVAGMSNMVFEMLQNGWTDAQICNHLGLEPEEIIKLKHITGFSKLFENAEYNQAFESTHQIKLRLKHNQQNDGKVA